LQPIREGDYQSSIDHHQHPQKGKPEATRKAHAGYSFEFIEKHPEATIVNIGCGLDTTFSRIDNGKIQFYELDLPDVIALRKNLRFEHDLRHELMGYPQGGVAIIAGKLEDDVVSWKIRIRKN
jgi:hypothetical protein